MGAKATACLSKRVSDNLGRVDAIKFEQFKMENDKSFHEGHKVLIRKGFFCIKAPQFDIRGRDGSWFIRCWREFMNRLERGGEG
jgi:hypothetical protein